LAVSLVDPKASTVAIWMTDLARGNTSRFTSEGRPNASPAWSRDGARLLYRSNPNGVGNQFVRRSAGGGGREELVLTIEAERAAQIRGAILFPLTGLRTGSTSFSWFRRPIRSTTCG